jgi:ATP synthase protein I
MSEQLPPGERRGLLDAVRIRGERRRRRLAEGEPSLARNLGQVGVLGWTIVLPALVGLFLGRWLDHRFGTGIFWSAPLLLLGLALGCWTGWKWMRRS